VLATALSGVWQQSVPATGLAAAELAEILPLLLKSGSAALAWWRVRRDSLRNSPAALELQQAYRLHTLQAAIHEQEIRQGIPFLRSRGIEPLLGKGWAVARLYPEPGLRPYGDIDLYVRPEQYDATSEALRGPGVPAFPADLHRGCAELDDRSFDELWRRSLVVKLDASGAEVRVFGPEDHLRLLCLHTLRHGAWRPLWLCDIAVALETRPADFDWDYFLGGDQRRTDWIACAIGLAHQLLGARVAGTPVEWRAGHLPGWLISTVLRQWGAGQIPHGTRRPMENYLRDPAGLLGALRMRWPNAIEATVGVRGPFNNWPRLPFQLGECVARTFRFVMQTGLSRS